MRIHHHLVLRGTSVQMLAFKHARPKRTLGGFYLIHMYEDDPRWPELRDKVHPFQVADNAVLEFDDHEMSKAPWLDMRCPNLVGYPYPDRKFGYRSTTYDSNRRCGACGVEEVQQAPFRLSRVPNPNDEDIFQIHWVPQEFFIVRSAWDSIINEFSLTVESVLHRRGTPLDWLGQLRVPLVDSVDLDVAGLDCETCEECGSIKFALPYLENSLPRVKGHWPATHLALSRQFFGAGGASASRVVLVSQRLYRRILAEGIRGAVFAPVFAADSG